MKKDVVRILKSTLNSLNEKDLSATPKNYSKEFYSLAKKSNAQIEDVQSFQNVINSLGKEEQKLFEDNQYNSYTELSEILLNRISVAELREFTNALDVIMAPSINYDIEDEIDKIVLKLKANPKELFLESTLEKLKNISRQRQEQDRIAIREKANDIVKLTKLMGKYFDKSLIQSGNTIDEVKHIKSELDDLELSSQSNREIGILQSKVVDTVFKLENTMEKNKIELIQNQSDFNDLHETIEKLQQDLQKEKAEKNIDYLTGLLNRRAYGIEIEKFENKFTLFDSSYAVIFLDIDHFKKINDNHGHDCGDTVLKTFANILKMLTRDEDKVIRYGGEEFVTLIRYENEKEVLKYVTRIKQLVEKNIFVYNDIKIKVNFCAGVSLRSKYNNYTDTVNKADKLLYEAKHSGRNKIILDNGHTI